MKKKLLECIRLILLIMLTISLIHPINGYYKAIHTNTNNINDTLLNIPTELIDKINHYVPTHEKIIDIHYYHGLNVFKICHVCNLEIATICHENYFMDKPHHELCVSCYTNKKYCNKCDNLDWFDYNNLLKQTYYFLLKNEIHDKIKSIYGVANFCYICRWQIGYKCVSCKDDKDLIECYHPSLLEGIKSVYFCRKESCHLGGYRKIINDDLLKTQNDDDFDLLVRRTM